MVNTFMESNCKIPPTLQHLKILEIRISSPATTTLPHAPPPFQLYAEAAHCDLTKKTKTPHQPAVFHSLLRKMFHPNLTSPQLAVSHLHHFLHALGMMMMVMEICEGLTVPRI